jgi:hypothetical protein
MRVFKARKTAAQEEIRNFYEAMVLAEVYLSERTTSEMRKLLKAWADNNSNLKVWGDLRRQNAPTRESEKYYLRVFGPDMGASLNGFVDILSTELRPIIRMDVT